MASYLGFQPTTSTPYYFVSYSTEDAAKVGPIVQILSQKLPLWYDYGLTYGEGWGKDIADHIENSEAVLLFLSRQIFAKGLNSYVYTEYQMAKDFFQKPIIIIQIEGITRSDITNDLLGWWIELNRYQNIIRHPNTSDESLANQIYKAVVKDIGDHFSPSKELPEKPATEIPITPEPLLKRAFLYLEDSEWQNADEYCEKVLDLDPENAKAYLGKFMAELKVNHQEDLVNCEKPFDNNKNFQKAIRFGDEKFRETLNSYIAQINERIENDRRMKIYNKVLHTMNSATTEIEYKNAARLFDMIPGFKDADELKLKCLEEAEKVRVQKEQKNKDAIYEEAKAKMDTASTSSLIAASKLFEEISGWRDADELAKECREKAEANGKDSIYAAGIQAMTRGQWESSISAYRAAIIEFKRIPDWKDANGKLITCQRRIELLKTAQKAKAANQGQVTKEGSVTEAPKSSPDTTPQQEEQETAPDEKKTSPWVCFLLAGISIVMAIENINDMNAGKMYSVFFESIPVQYILIPLAILLFITGISELKNKK